MSGKGMRGLACGDIPQADCPVIAARSQATPIRRPSYAGKIRGVSHKSVNGLASGNVPYADRLVIAS